MLTTTTTLLEGLADSANVDAWGRFDAFYRPYVRRVAGRYGLSAAESDDVAQTVMVEFHRGFVAKYRRESGRLRYWVLGIARRQVAAALRARRGRPAILGEESVTLLDENAVVAEQEWRACIAERAMALLRDKRSCRLAAAKIEAFERFALRQEPAADVALHCGMTVDDVFRSKYLCLRYLRRCRSELARFYDA